MAISLSSALLVAALVQTGTPAPASPAPPVPPSPPTTAAESLAALRAQAERDSSDGPAWLVLGRAYLRLAHDAHRSPADTAATRAVLDTADAAFIRAAALLEPAGADSARVLRIGGWSARSRLAWEARGLKAGPDDWGPLPPDLRLPAVLEELGENLLRACPQHGVLLTAAEPDSYAAWYMRFVRGLRPDVVVMPLAAWRKDSLFAVRLERDLKLPPRTSEDRRLAALAKRRPVCVSMAFERPPDTRGRVKWEARPLLWVAGPVAAGDRVPPRDFVFAALGAALDERDPWAEPALALYARAVRTSHALCEPLSTFKAASGISACRR
jgi:hypothetical protein